MACLLLFLVALVSCLSQVSLADKGTEDLMAKIIHARGNAGVMPVDGGVTVSVGAALIRIIDFDHLNGIATVSLWERLLWQDERLRWDPSSYGDQSRIRVDYRDVWRPDITCYSDVNADVSIGEYNAIVHSTGEVLHIPKVVRRIPCYPLDDNETWKCIIKYGSWSFDGNQIGLDEYEGVGRLDLSDYARHPNYKIAKGEWDQGAKVTYYPCCDEPYPSVTLPFFVKHRSYLGDEDEVIQDVLNNAAK